jgi:peptide/nickel transport system substrate-binding protein
MRKQPKVALAACLVAAAATVLAACSSSGGNPGTQSSSSSSGSTSSSSSGSSSSSQGVQAAFNAGQDNVVNPSTQTGGTLNLLAGSDCDSWDPGRTYYGWCWNMQRLFTRTLIGFKKVNGTSFQLAPDLATNMGTHNKNYTKWTYTLQPGLKFSTGKPITPMDIKYGIERLFATDVINGGPSSYYIDTIKHPANYKGPYKSGDLSSIQTTSNKITFNLSTPYADFNYLMALPAAAPVPYKVEGGKGFVGATYTKHPVASGPFMIKSYQQNNEIVFVRNPNWSQSTDQIRHPLVDEVDLKIDKNLDDIDQQLQNGSVDARADNGVEPTFQSQILSDPTLKANADDPIGNLVRYMAVMQTVITNVHCRRAIFYAFDKAGALRALGGPTSGAIATEMTPPGIEGYQKGYDQYPSGSGSTGNVAKAKQELQACGKPNGFTVKFAYATPSDTAPNLFKAEQAAMAKVGIKLQAVTSDASNYYSTFIGSPANIKNQGIGMAIAGWGPDFPTGLGFFNSITNGKNILPTGNSNYASLNNSTVNRVLDEAVTGKTTEKDWQDLDHAIMESATYLPFVDGKTLYYRNPKMTNATCDNALAFGIYDFVNAGVSS